MFINYDSDITITKIDSTIRLRNSPVGTTTVRNNRERWAVVLKTSGKTYYTVHEKEILSDKLHPVILPKGCSYSWKCVEPGECIIIEFDAIQEYRNILPFEITNDSFLINSFAKIEKKFNLQSMNFKMECINLLYGVLLFLLKTVNKKYIPNGKKDILQPAIDYIANNYYDSTITNDRLAAACGISTIYFRKIFERVYEISPIKYLNNFRMEKAKSMLLSDIESITLVAQNVGYNSIYHFSKMFKIHTGMSPSEYKNARLF